MSTDIHTHDEQDASRDLATSIILYLSLSLSLAPYPSLSNAHSGSLQDVLVILSSDGWVEDDVVNGLDELQLNHTPYDQEREERTVCCWHYKGYNHIIKTREGIMNKSKLHICRQTKT